MSDKSILSDKQLIDALRGGSHKAFRIVFDNYKKRVYSFLYGILHTHSDAEELTQRVFVKVWDHKEKLNQELSVQAYIYKIAKNIALNFLRDKVYRLRLEQRLVERFDETVEEADMEENNMKQYINSLIIKIPERRREIFLLRYRQKMSYKEIAERLQITENTVDTQIRNSLRFIREQIGKELAEK